MKKTGTDMMVHNSPRQASKQRKPTLENKKVLDTIRIKELVKYNDFESYLMFGSD